MPRRAGVVPVGRVVQTSPFVEVWIVPREPAPTNSPFPYAMASRLLAVPETDGVQVKPSIEVTALVALTATNVPLPKATADNGGGVCEIASGQPTPSGGVTVLPTL